VLLAAALAALPVASAGASEGGITLVPPVDMLVSLIVLFVILVFPVNALLFRPILTALDAREDRIEGTRARAQELAAETDEILGRYESQIRAARDEAETERRESLAEARTQSQAEAAAARGEAERDIEQARRRID
jgi:F0F1-type ATP synthase membrane subunit b/b'